jgi:chemotaxis protein MotB
MSQIEDNSPSEEEGTEGWLVSYADLMTLIACFFILMMAFANYDPPGFNKKAKELSKHFNKGKYKSSEVKMTQITEEISKHPELKKKLKISVKDDSLLLTFSGSTLFKEGQFLMIDDSVILLDSLIDIIKSINPDFRIFVEGHTGSRKDVKASIFNSSWVLSGARSASIIERFEYFGFDPQKLILIGKGDSSPLAENFNKKGELILENQMVNRRVMIKVLEPLEKVKQMKMGLGVYFKDSVEEDAGNE